jgi:hypothetical protein
LLVPIFREEKEFGKNLKKINLGKLKENIGTA